MRELLEKTLEEVRKENASGDIIFQSSKSLKLSAFGKELTEYKVSGSQLLGLRIIKDNKVGLAYTESLDNDSLKYLVKTALQNAQASSENEYEFVDLNEGEVHDEELSHDEDVDVETKIKKVTSLLEDFKKQDSRVESLPYNGYVENENFNMYLNTHNRFTTRKDQFFQTWAMPLLLDNGKKSTYYDYSVATSYQGLDWDKLKDGTLAVAGAMLKSTHLKTSKYHVEFSPNCLNSYFQKFSSLFSAKAVVNKMNAWEKSLGKQVMHESLTLVDDSFFKDAFSHYRCDSEGNDHKKVSLIEDGVLKTFLHNSSTAKQLGHDNTNHALRGPGSSLGVGRTNFIITGKETHHFNEPYVEIIQLDGLFSGANEVTGDFSCGAKGFLHKDGEKIPFADATLSGNFFDMLKNLSVRDLKLQADTGMSLFTPKLIFHELSIAGQGA